MTQDSSPERPASDDLGEHNPSALVEVDELLLTRHAIPPGVAIVPTSPANETDHEAFALGPWLIKTASLEAPSSRGGPPTLAVVWSRELRVPRELLADASIAAAPAAVEAPPPVALLGVQHVPAAPPAPSAPSSVQVDNVRPFGSQAGGHRVMERGAPSVVNAGVAQARPEQAAMPPPPAPSPLLGVNAPGPEVSVRPYAGPPLSPFTAVDGSIVTDDPYGAGVAPVPLPPLPAQQQAPAAEPLPSASSYAGRVGGLRRAPAL